jgi:dihydrofolate reductase
MRKLTSFLFMSLDGVVEAPQVFVRPELYEEFPALIGEIIAEQDAVLMGRTTYAEWAPFWPGSDIQPFAGFINRVPKFVVSSTLSELDWAGSHLLSGALAQSVSALKASSGGAIGVHGSIGLVSALLRCGLLDELRLIVCPALAGSGRRLLPERRQPLQLVMVAARSTPSGLQYLVYRPL